MNARQAKQVLRAYRPSGEDDDEREVREALKIARRTPALDAEFQNQVAFDRELADLMDEELSAEWTAELEAAARKLEGPRCRRMTLRDPAVLAIGFAFLALIAVVVWLLVGRMGAFSGMEETVAIAQQGDRAGVQDFEAVETQAGLLPDWFVMQSFDGFVVPRGMEALPVVGARITKHDNVPVAVAVVAEPRLFCYAFEAKAFGVSLPEGNWRIVSYGAGNKKSLAVTQVGGTVFIVVPREGGRAEFAAFIESLK